VKAETRRDGGPEESASVIARVQTGAVVGLERGRGGWCRLQREKRRGWAQADAFWGVYPEEMQPGGALESAERACYRSGSNQSAVEPAPTGSAD